MINFCCEFIFEYYQPYQSVLSVLTKIYIQWSAIEIVQNFKKCIKCNALNCTEIERTAANGLKKGTAN
jgi:hypothetical protein